MILKLTRKQNYNIEDDNSTEGINVSQFETDYISNIKQIKRSTPDNNRNNISEDLIIDFNNGEQMVLIIGEFKQGIYYPCYKNVFLMNDEGKTIERLI